MMYEYFLLNEPSSAAPSSVECAIHQAYRWNQIPSISLVADGPDDYHYAKTLGENTEADDLNTVPLEDPIFWIGECSEFLTAVAALQCIEKGLVDLDEDILDILSELKPGVHEDSTISSWLSILITNAIPVTLRQLLTHTSGLQVDSAQPSKPDSSTSAFAPGKQFRYCNLNTKLINLFIAHITLLGIRQFVQTNIFDPLNMRDSTFDLDDRPDLKARLMKMSRRQGLIHPIYETSLSPNGEVILDTDDTLRYTDATKKTNVSSEFESEVSDDVAYAEVVHCSAPDLAKFLHSLSSNDGQLLRPETVDLMFRRQLSPTAVASLEQILTEPEAAAIFGIQMRDRKTIFDYGFGGCLVIDEATGRRIMRGAGSPNIYWWIDLEMGISGVWATQLLPKGDRQCLALEGKFERSVYQAVRQ